MIRCSFSRIVLLMDSLIMMAALCLIKTKPNAIILSALRITTLDMYSAQEVEELPTSDVFAGVLQRPRASPDRLILLVMLSMLTTWRMKWGISLEPIIL